jgi:tetratricopeptide (TPR) repeat protein
LHIFKRALVVHRKATLGDNDSSALQLENDLSKAIIAIDNIASMYDKEGCYVQALEGYQAALDGFTQLYGEDHLHTIETIDNIASVYNKQGDYTRALKWYLRAFDWKEKIIGEEHSSTLETISNIVSVCSKQDWYENDIALINNNQGESGEASEWHQRAIAIREKSQAKDRRSTLKTISDIISVYNDRGEEPPGSPRIARPSPGPTPPARGNNFADLNPEGISSLQKKEGDD